MSESFSSKIRAGFESYLTRGNQSQSQILEFAAPRIVTASARAEIHPIVPQYYFQNLIRPIWGKAGITPPAIGDHPDFKDLAGTNEIAQCPITTLFMDIESSTRLGVLYRPEQVFKIKNAFIGTAIEVIQAFEGHVHRIMGDAVMAFFGGKYVQPENAVLQALNAAGMIVYVVKKAIIPKLTEEGYENPFGIRIGIDYGSREEVLWSSYGFPGANEVTATSFFVDAASKLQHAAPRNAIMLGQSLRDFIFFPKELLKNKRVQSGATETDELYLLPNITDRAKRPINYRQYILDSVSYLSCSPVAPHDSEVFKSENTLGPVSVSIYKANEKDGAFEGSYTQCGSFLEKEKWLCFEVKLLGNSDVRMPLKIKFEVENHGEEAEKDDNNGNHVTEKPVSSNSSFRSGIQHWEHAKYRGIHYMKIVILNGSGERKFERCFGVCIV